MAGLPTFNISRIIQQLLGNFTRSFEGIFYGYEMNDVSVENKNGSVTAKFTCRPKGSNSDVNLVTFITATNIGEAFSDITKAIDNLSYQKLQSDSKLRDTVTKLVGTRFSPNVGEDGNKTNDYTFMIDEYGGPESKRGEIFNDISLETAISSGTGLLGVDLSKCSINDSGDWYNIAHDELRYELICETDNGDDDVGKIDNLTLLEVIDWIYKYIEHIGTVSSDRQMSAEEKEAQSDVQLKNEEGEAVSETSNEASIEDGFNMIRPILESIQAELRKRYQTKLNSDTSLDRVIQQPGENKNQTNNESEEAQDSTENNGGEEDVEQSAAASAHINITLKKIQASDDIDVLLLEANCPPADTLNYVDDIINQDEFFDTLTEEPQSYSIDVSDDGYDIEKCDELLECDACKILSEVFQAAIQAYRNLYIIHWMSSGPDMMKLHTMSEDMYSELVEEIDTLGELLVEKCETVPTLDFPCEYIDIKKYDLQSGLDAIKIVIQPYIDVIDYAYPNQTSDVQSTLDEWLRYWNKQMNYFIKNQEM